MSNELSYETKEGAGVVAIISISNQLEELSTQMALLKSQIKTLTERKEVIENGVKKYMLEHSPKLKSVTTTDYIVTLKEPSTVRVIVDNEDSIPDTYMRTKTTTEPNKEKIRVALKEGTSVPGTHLEQSEPTLLITMRDE